MGLTLEQIRELQAKKRTKGVYEDRLVYLYNESDEAGIDVAETWPLDFAGKNATTLYQGFNNAAKKLELEDSVDIVNRDGHCFILVKSRVALVIADITNGNGNGNDEVEAETEADDSPELDGLV